MPASFNAPQAYGVDAGPIGISFVDVNRDGRRDIVSANIYSDTVTVLLGQTDGTFGQRQDYEVGDGPLDIIGADVDGDGLTDLVTANHYGFSVSVLFGQSNGTLGRRQDYSVGFYPEGLTSGDVNGDGRRDIITANYGASSVSVLLGQEDGSLLRGNDVNVGLEPVDVVSADVNGDGRLDLATANIGGGVTVLLGQPDGTVGQRQDYAGPVALGVISADVNGDGRADLMTANYHEASVSVFLGLAGGGFAQPQSYGVGTNPWAVSSADVNGDGRIDLISANHGSGSVSVLLGQGDGTFGQRTDYEVGTNPIDVTAGDANGDTAADIIVSRQFGNTVSVLMNNLYNSAPTANADTLNAIEDTPVGFTASQLLGNDADTDGDPLHIDSVTPGAGGDVVLNQDGTVTFSPSANFNGAASFTYTAGDGRGGTSNPATVTVNVASVNDAPSLDLNGPGDGIQATLAYTENQAPTAIAPDALLADIDSANFNNGFLSVTGGSAFRDRLTIRNEGTGEGQIGVSGNTITYGGVTIGTFQSPVTGHTMLISFTSDAATRAAVQALARSILYSNTSETGSAPVRLTFGVVDGDGTENGGRATGQANALITFNPINDAPSLDLNGGEAGTNVTLSYAENQAPLAVAPQALVSDIDSGNFNGGILNIGFDTGGSNADQLTIRNEGTGSGQIGVSGNTVTFGGVEIGTFAGGANGGNIVVSFTSDVATPAAVQALTRSILYSNTSENPSTVQRNLLFVLVDGDGNASGGNDVARANAFIDVTRANDAPIGSPTASLPPGTEDTLYVVNRSDLLAGFSDPDGDALAVTGLTADRGTVLADAAGNYRITPAPNDNGPVVLSYTVSDGNGGAVAASQSFTLAPVNDRPVASPVTLTAIAEDSGARTITQADLLAGVRDIDSSSLAITALAIAGGNGSLTQNADGTWTYTPASNDDTGVSFSYTASDGALTASSTASLDITPVNDAPVAVADTVADPVRENEEGRRFNVVANDTDVDAGDTLRLVAVANSRFFTIQDGQILFTPGDGFDDLGAGQTRTASVGYTVADLAGATSSATLTLTVVGVANAAPIAGTNQSDAGATALRGDRTAAGAEDAISGGNGDDELHGLGGSDTLGGGNGNDKLYGGDGADFLYGDNGNDTLEGGAGNDLIGGGNGDDRLIGGLGNDTMSGGNNPDIFVFGANSGADTITDFILGTDRFALEAGTSITSFQTVGPNTLIQLSGGTVTLQGVTNVQSINQLLGQA